MTIDPRRQAMPLRDRPWPRSSVGRILQVSLWASAAAGISSAGVAVKEDPTAQLDLFVAGTINSSDVLTIGNVNYPALSRTYVGGAAALSFSSGATLASNLYAP